MVFMIKKPFLVFEKDHFVSTQTINDLV